MSESGDPVAGEDGRPSRRLRGIQDRLAALPRHQRTFRHSLAWFGEGFERDRFVAAVVSDDLEQLARVDAVERGYEKLVNMIVEVIDDALAEAAEREIVSDRGRWQGLGELGVLPAARIQRLRDAVNLRNRIQHAYPDLQPEMLHAGIEAFLQDYSQYLEDLRRLIELIQGEAGDRDSS